MARQIANARTRSQFNRLVYRPASHGDRDVPQWIDGTLEKAVHPNPCKRYDSFSEFLFDLRHPNANYLATFIDAADRAQSAAVLEMHDGGAGAGGDRAAGDAARDASVVVRHAPLQAGHPVLRVASFIFTMPTAAYWVARSSRAMTVQFAAIGSMPLLTISARAAGEARNLISALPASGSFETAGDAGGKHRDLLQFVRQRTDDVDAFHRLQFADLLEADLGLAARDDLADRRGRESSAPCPSSSRLDAELVEHLGRDIDAAGAVGIGDGLRGQQRALERIGRGDIRLRRA